MIRDYQIGVSESLDFEVTDAGAGTIPVRADGVYANAFSTLALYTDSDRLIPISSGSYEMSTIDTILTSNEAGTGGTSATIYADYELLDPTYQTDTIYGTITNFGTYTNGVACGQDYIVLDDDDYSFTIEPTVYETILDCSNFTANRTITFTQGTNANIKNKVTVINPSDYRAILTDSTTTNWCSSGEQYQVYFNQDTFTRSTGWGIVYDDDTNIYNYVDKADILGGTVSTGERYALTWDGGTTYSYYAEVKITDSTKTTRGMDCGGATAGRALYTGSTGQFSNEITSIDLILIEKFYTGF